MPACMAQPLQRNPWTTNAIPTQVESSSTLIVTNKTGGASAVILLIGPNATIVRNLRAGNQMQVGPDTLTAVNISSNRINFPDPIGMVSFFGNGAIIGGSDFGGMILVTNSTGYASLLASNLLSLGFLYANAAIFTNTYTWFGNVIADDATTTYSVSNTTTTVITNFHMHATNGVTWNGLGTLTNLHPGYYLLSHTEAFGIDTQNQLIEHHMLTNGIDAHLHTEVFQGVTVGSRSTVGNSGIVYLPANTAISLVASNQTGTCVMTNRELSMWIKKL